MFVVGTLGELWLNGSSCVGLAGGMAGPSASLRMTDLWWGGGERSRLARYPTLRKVREGWATRICGVWSGHEESECFGNQRGGHGGLA